MRITTTYVGPVGFKGSKIVAKFAGRQKSTAYDPALSSARNHGYAAANVVKHVQNVAPELQYGDNIVSALVRSLDNGYGKHTSNDSGSKHVFEV